MKIETGGFFFFSSPAFCKAIYHTQSLRRKLQTTQITSGYDYE